MKTRVNKESYILLAILTIFVFGSFITFGKATTDDFTFTIEEFKETIRNSPEDSWKKPAQNRKSTICNKLTELQQLIEEENFKEAYNKLLHDIKPKLTGLKQDEHGIPWGNGVYDQAWVTCSNLRANFIIECDLILDQINPFSVYDDDKTPPTISIIYEGGHYLANLGVWHIVIEDLESGINEVLIEINGIVYINDQNLGGLLSLTYNDIPLPLVINTHMIVVTAINDDNDHEWDQEIATETDWVEILEDTTAPIINIVYQGENNEINPGDWIVSIEDSESGVDEVEIFVDGLIKIYEKDLNGITSVIDYLFSVPIELGTHSIVVKVKNLSGLERTIADSVEIEPYYPLISIVYEGSGMDFDTGAWLVDVIGAHLMEVVIYVGSNPFPQIHEQFQTPIHSWSFRFALPILAGDHFIKVAAKYGDFWIEETLTTHIEDDDTTPPTIEVLYVGSGTDYDPGWWNVYITDVESGIDDVLILVNGFEMIHDENLGGILSISYTGETGGVITPTSIGSHMIEVISINNDNDYEGDQESSYYVEIKEIIFDPIFGIDISPPTIYLDYSGEATDEDPGEWLVEVGDPDSGIEEVTIKIDEVTYVFETNLGGLGSKIYEHIPVPDTLGVHVILIIVTNGAGIQYSFDSSVSIQEAPDDPDPPPIIIL